jgi:hypothetical protein
MKEDEDKAIDQLITSEGFEVLKKYPQDSVFGEKQFVVLDNGVYLNVVDSGNGNRAVAGRTTVLMRCSGRFIFKADTSAFSIFSNGYDPIEFIYGNASNTISQYASLTGSPTWLYLSAGVESVLAYVGENAVVKLIVPFEQGSTYQSTGGGTSYTYGAPLYYDKIKFTFY